MVDDAGRQRLGQLAAAPDRPGHAPAEVGAHHRQHPAGAGLLQRQHRPRAEVGERRLHLGALEVLLDHLLRRSHEHTGGVAQAPAALRGAGQHLRDGLQAGPDRVVLKVRQQRVPGVGHERAELLERGSVAGRERGDLAPCPLAVGPQPDRRALLVDERGPGVGPDETKAVASEVQLRHDRDRCLGQRRIHGAGIHLEARSLGDGLLRRAVPADDLTRLHHQNSVARSRQEGGAGQAVVARSDDDRVVHFFSTSGFDSSVAKSYTGDEDVRASAQGVVRGTRPAHGPGGLRCRPLARNDGMVYVFRTFVPISMADGINDEERA